MTRYVVIEDERFAYEEIKRMMLRLRPDYVLSGWAGSVEQAVLLLSRGETDLVLADICLADGLSFEVFEQTPADVPVIFTTAYDEYALRAFRVNGIDYLLKPVDEADLSRALEKFERSALAGSRSAAMQKAGGDYISHGRKNRFLVQVGDAYQYVDTPDVAYFLSEEKYTYLYLFSGKRYIVDHSLDALMPMLDASMFFRVSRHCITNIRAVARCTKYFGSRLKLHLTPQCPREILISRGRTADFLRWIDGGGA